MDRLSGLDASFLYLETPAQLMHVCALMVLDPSTMPSSYAFDELMAHIDDSVHDVPAFTRKIRGVPMGLDHPVWVRDQQFDIAGFLKYSLRFGPISPHPVKKTRHPEAPEVTLTVRTPSSHASSSSVTSSMRYDAFAPASSATSTRRTEFDELAEPTTITRSAVAPISFTATWRFWVA